MVMPHKQWNRLFPESLLNASIDEKLQYFDELHIEHAIFNQVLAEILDIVFHPGQISILMILGPSRVGKTWLINALSKALEEHADKDPYFHPGRMVVGRQSAKPPTKTKFDWQYFFRDGLLQAKEILIDRKLAFTEYDFCTQDGKHVFKLDIRGDSLLRDAFINTLKHRLPYCWIVDEAQDIGWALKVAERRTQMDVVKDISNSSGILFILFGTHNLTNLLNLSGQLAGRTHYIEFPRYKAHIPENFEEFMKMIRTLQKHIPLKNEPNLVKHANFLYERTNGCIGLVKRWLYRVLTDVLDSQSEIITRDALKRRRIPIKNVLTMLDRIERGEVALAEFDEEISELKRRQGRDPLSAKDELFDAGEETVGTKETGRKGRSKPGQRNPRRDPVGRNNTNKTDDAGSG